jgi:predicted aldo/keto reductase-like oxidoreductase
MNYRKMGKNGDNVSVLGFGCMRFPHTNGRIDIDRTERQILMALDQGVNYFDTALLYHGGKSESILGDILSKGYRDRVKIATKLPPFMANSQRDMNNVLGNQLKKLKTDYVDYYLLHAVNDLGGWERLKRLGIREFAEKAKKDGKILNFGFSFHGDKDDFKAIVDDFDWDMCQIQYNYIDEDFQAGREGLEHAASKGIGVVIMEPLRGGSLVRKMPPEIQRIWDSADVKRTPADWAFRWLWNQPGVTTVLSGMNEETQIEENTALADIVRPNTLTAEELSLYEDVRSEYFRRVKVGCTGCGYCIPCPAGVDIPFCFSYYNAKHFFKAKNAQWQYTAFAGGLMSGKPSLASQCIQCGKCEKVCPQKLPVREKLKEVVADMESSIFKPAMWAVRKYYSIRSGRKKPTGEE